MIVSQAMRDNEGNMVQNAHLLGMFTRICRLLYHHIRPVFVFDGRICERHVVVGNAQPSEYGCSRDRTCTGAEEANSRTAQNTEAEGR